MKKKALLVMTVLLAIFLTFGITACSKDEAADTATSAPKSERETLLSRFSYTIGYSNASYMKEDPVTVPNGAYLLRGIIDYNEMEDRKPLMLLDDIGPAYESFLSTNRDSQEIGENLGEKKIMKLAEPQTDHEKYSYAFGFILASNALYQFGDMDLEAMANGIEDALYNLDSEMTEEEMTASVTDYSNFVQKEYEETVGKEMKANLEEADTFFKENAAREGIVIPNEYCQLKFNTNGPKSEKVELGDSVKLNYRLTNLQGEVLDEGNGVVFPMDTNQMIKGFVEGCIEMYVGDSATVYVHPEHGYGTQGPNGIGPNRLLIFDIDILGIEK